MKLAIIGSGGFLGRHLVNEVLRQDVASTIWVTSPVPRRPELRLLDVQWGAPDFSPLFKEDDPPDHIIYCAGKTGGGMEELLSANVVSTVSLLRAIRRNTKIVFLGSAAEYGYPLVPEDRIFETHSFRPVSDYGISKYLQAMTAESFNRDHIKICSAKVFNPIGEFSPESLFMGSVLHQIENSANDRVIRTGPLTAVRDFITCSDVSKMIIGLLQNEWKHFNYNICSGVGVGLNTVMSWVMSELPDDFQHLESTDRNSRKSGSNRIVGDSSRIGSLIQSVRFESVEAEVRKLTRNALIKATS